MAGSSGAIRAGRAYVELLFQDNMFTKGLDRAQKKFQSVGGWIAKAGAGAGAAGAVIGAPIAKSFTDAASRGEKIQQLSRNSDSSTESVSALAYAFERAGTGLDAFGEKVKSLQDSISHAADMNDELVSGLRGLRGRDLLNMPIGKQFDQIAEKIKGIPVAADRARVANGLGIGELLPWLEKGKAGLDELRTAAAEAGATLTPEQAEQSRQIMQAYTATWQQVKYAVLEVGNQLLPTGAKIAEFSKDVRDAITQVREWIIENRGAVVAVAAIAGALVAGGVAFVALGAAISTVGTVLGAVSAGIGLVGAGIGALMSPMGAITAAVVGLGVVWGTTSESGKKATSALSESFTSMGATFKNAWSGITAALSSGDLSLAGKVATKGLEAIWSEMVLGLTKAWVEFKNMFVDSFHEIQDKITFSLAGLKAGFIWATEGRGAAEKFGAETAEQLDAMKKERERDNKAFRDRQVADAAKAREEAKAALNELVGKAKDQAAAGKIKKDPELANAIKKEASVGNQMTRVFDSVKGTFHGPIGQQLGYGDNVAQRQLDQLNNLNKNLQGAPAALAVAPQMAKDMNNLVNAMRFK